MVECDFKDEGVFLAETPTIKCRVCGAENPSDLEYCESCGVKLEAATAKESADVDKLLEELVEVAPAEGAAAPGDKDLDVEKELVDELLDSLLIEGGTEPEEFECPLCGKPLPLNAEVCIHCGARFPKEGVVIEPTDRPAPPPKAQIPVAVSVTEEDVSKIRISSGRLIDFTVLGTVIALVVIFLAGSMYSSASISENPIFLIVFIVVAIAGIVIGYIFLQISMSAIAQGDRLVKDGNYQDSLYYYDKAIRMGSRPSSAWASKGVALKRLGRFEEALHCQNVALRLEPENEIAWCNKGDVYFKLGNLTKAIECYNKAIDIRPKYAIAWNNKGAVLALSGRFNDAKACHDKAVELKPKYVAAWLNRGEVLARLGQREEAAECLAKAKALGA